MAVAINGVAGQTGTGNLSYTHTPTDRVTGILVYILYDTLGTDQVASVTYGGVSLTEVPGSPNLKTTGEVGAVHAFFLGRGIPQGAQTVAVTVSGAANKRAVSIALTSSGYDTKLEASDASLNTDSSAANPSATLTTGAGINCLILVGWFSGFDAPANVTPLSGWTERNEIDLGNYMLGVYSQNALSTGGAVSYGVTQAAGEDFAAIGVALTEDLSVTSALWGADGELWVPESRLPDFSFAGYHMGGVPLPNPPVTLNVVTDFGAVSGTDCTTAFLAAIAAMEPGDVLFIPNGTYEIHEILHLTQSGVVLRGESEAGAILSFPESLFDVYGQGPHDVGVGYSHAGGWIRVEGSDAGTQITTITANASRGSKAISVASAVGLSVGQMVRVMQSDDATGTLSNTQFNEPSSILWAANRFGPQMMDFATRITEISGLTVTLARPLRIDLDTDWTPRLMTYAPTVSEVGVEYLTLLFPNVAAASHGNEPGYHGLCTVGIVDCWFRSITITHPDTGIMGGAGRDDPLALTCSRMRWCTFDHITVNGRVGHTNLEFPKAEDCLISNFTLPINFFHDMSVWELSCGNVFSKGVVNQMNLDHHRYAPYENLYTEIIYTTMDYSSGGNTALQESGPREVLWNVSTATGVPPNTVAATWPELTIVGHAVHDPQPTGIWREGISPFSLTPQNLYEAQLALRLASEIGTRPDALFTQLSVLGVPGGLQTFTAKTSASPQISLSGTLTSVSEVSATLNTQRPLSGTKSAVSGLSTDLSTARLLSALLPGSTSLSTGFARLAALDGSQGGLSSLTGTVDAARGLLGQVSALSTITADLSLEGVTALQGTLAGTSTLTALLARATTLNTPLTSVSTLTATTRLALAVTGQLTSLSTGAADLTMTGVLVLQGTLAGISTLTATASVVRPLNGTLDALSLMAVSIGLGSELQYPALYTLHVPARALSVTSVIELMTVDVPARALAVDSITPDLTIPLPTRDLSVMSLVTSLEVSIPARPLSIASVSPDLTSPVPARDLSVMSLVSVLQVEIPARELLAISAALALVVPIPARDLSVISALEILEVGLPARDLSIMSLAPA